MYDHNITCDFVLKMSRQESFLAEYLVSPFITIHLHPSLFITYIHLIYNANLPTHESDIASFKLTVLSGTIPRLEF
jgi:hypothetical protein